MKNELTCSLNAAARVIELLKEKNQTVCSCESLTAGLFCAELGSIPGASAVFKGGLVTYFTQMKEVIAQVPQAIIERYGVISKECALAMAEHTRDLMQADYCVSFTGNAGPDAMEGKPAGLVYCAIAGPDIIKLYCLEYKLPRNALRVQVVEQMLENLARILEQEPKPEQE